MASRGQLAPLSPGRELPSGIRFPGPLNSRRMEGREGRRKGQREGETEGRREEIKIPMGSVTLEWTRPPKESSHPEDDLSNTHTYLQELDVEF